MVENKGENVLKGKMRRSLATKTFITLQLILLVLGLALLSAGYFLYYFSTLYNYSVNTSNLAKAESYMLSDRTAFLEEGVSEKKANQILEIYDSIPEEQRGDGTGADYKKKFEGVLDQQFRDIQKSIQLMRDHIGLRNAFIVAIDREKNRMVYLIDADPNPKTFCYPGTWDTYADEDMRVLVEGRDLNFIQKQTGVTDKPHATITYTQKYGFRCTGGTILYKKGKYVVMMCLDEKLDYLRSVSTVFLLQYLLMLLGIMLLVGVIVLFIIRKNMVVPINRMAKAAMEYAETSNSDAVTTGHFRKLDISTGDEIEALNHTMADMEDSLTEYMNNLTKVTAERERINTELNLASRIQRDMLPGKFPPYPDRNEFDIYASMDPAKEVGGDFYDFLMTDEDHLAMIMADVSGKGVPAALFMMGSKILLDNQLMDTVSPAAVLERTNNLISANNREEMFVTVWLGILEISTGKVIAANAGHEKPVVIHPDGRAELINNKHGFVVGGMEGLKYHDYELKLEKGSKLFLYTDGVPEATSSEKGLFGTDRMLDALSGMKDENCRQVLEGVRASVDDFVGEDEQFDDLTMLCLEYRGTQTE